MMALINFKNMVTNSILIRVFWMIVGIIVGAFGLSAVMTYCDGEEEKRGRKPLFLQKRWYHSKEE